MRDRQLARNIVCEGVRCAVNRATGGVRGNLAGAGFGGKVVRTSYVVRERKRPAHLLPRAAWTDYHGTVYHVTVPNGAVYVRRNGKPLWSG